MHNIIQYNIISYHIISYHTSRAGQAASAAMGAKGELDVCVCVRRIKPNSRKTSDASLSKDVLFAEAAVETSPQGGFHSLYCL